MNKDRKLVMKTELFLFVSVLSLIALSSCQSYTPQVLNPEDVLQDLEKDHISSSINLENFSFVDATVIMSENNLKLKKLKASYAKYKKIAEIKTPWPNPALRVGPIFGSSLAKKSSVVQPFIGFGFTIPLGPRLRRNNELNHIMSLEAYNDTIITHRSLYFELKQAYIGHYYVKKYIKAQTALMEILELNNQAIKKLYSVGKVTKVDLAMVETQKATTDLDILQWKIQLKKEIGHLSELLVISTSKLVNITQEAIDVPKIKLDLKTMKSSLIKNNLLLAEKEMDFHKSDAKLRLELAKQYPDLNFGFKSDADFGETKRTFSFPFSIELPIFDRNQHSISYERSTREETLVKYKEALNGIILKFQTSCSQYQLSLVKLDLINNRLIPLSTQAIEDAKKTYAIGMIPPLRYFDRLTAHQMLELDKIVLEQDVWKKILEIEALIGIPLVDLGDNSPIPFSSNFKSK